VLFGHGEIVIVQGDITEQAVDAIVNAANNDLILGSGVAGAIRTKGGPTIQEECDKHGPIIVGEAALTGAGDLPARFVIHAASMGFGHPTTRDSLIDSTKASLQIALGKQLNTIAFPALGTGVSGFPIDECAKLMIDTAKKHLQEYQYPKNVLFVLFDQRSFQTFKETLITSQ
jgi:O-acetyl-ADP-ribose deacetylase (regulator of RNase III)